MDPILDAVARRLPRTTPSSPFCDSPMTQPETSKKIPQSEKGAAAAEAAGTAEADAEPARPEPEPWTPERVGEWNAYYDIYVMLGVFLLVFIASANKINHSSIWGQLQVGRQIMAKAAPVTTDLFSYTEEGKPWVNVPWLFDLAHAGAYKLAADMTPAIADDPVATTARADQVGAGTLVALDALIRVLTAVLLLAVRRAGPGKWWSALCVALALGAVLSPAGVALGGVAGPGLVAPGTWGLMLFALELLLLYRATIRASRGAAFALVPLFAVWANVDESFVIGLLVLAAAAVGEAWPSRGGKGDPAGGIGLPTALGVLAACALACLANPSTFRVYRAAFEPFLALFRPATDVVTIDQLSYFGPGLRKSSGEGVRALQAYYLILVALGLGSFVLNRRRFVVGRFLVFALMAFLWGVLIRFGPEFAAVLAVTLALNGQEWYQDRFGTAGRLGAWWSLWSVGGRMVTIGLIFLCVAKALLGGLPIAGFQASAEDTRFGFGYDPDDFAFEAADFLKTAAIKGNVLNTTVAQGDALVWRAFPERRTYLDGRTHLFPPEVRNDLQQVRRALSEDDKTGWKPLLDRYNVSAVLVQPSSARITYRALSQSPDWVPFYDDGQVVMFGRTDAGESDLAFFTKNRLDPDLVAYKQSKPTPAVDRPPTPVSWMDNLFQTRALTRPQPHTESARRWLSGPDSGAGRLSIPDPARCLAAIREARTALAAKPDDPDAFRLLAASYKALMMQETALLAGLKLSPENAALINQLNPRPDLLMTRFRQRVTALSYAIQTTPPPQTASTRRELQALNLELYQLFSSVNFLDLARDRLQAAVDKSGRDDFTPEGRAQLVQDLAQLNERINQVQTALSEMAVEQQPNPINLAGYAASQGAPALAIHELEEAERTGVNPALVKPRLIDLYCETGQPEKAIEMFSTGTINDPSFGAEPGIAALRQGRAYFLLGNDEYAATLVEKYAVPALRYDRGMKSITLGSGLIKGEFKVATATLLEIPEKLQTQAQWEFEAGLYRLEAGTPDLAAERFTKALTLAPSLPLRPIAAYYLEKLGKPVPPPSTSGTVAAPEKPATGPVEGPKASAEAKTDSPKAADRPKGGDASEARGSDRK